MNYKGRNRKEKISGLQDEKLELPVIKRLADLAIFTNVEIDLILELPEFGESLGFGEA